MANHIWLVMTDIFEVNHYIPLEAISSIVTGSFPGREDDVSFITLQGAESLIVAGNPQEIYEAILPQMASEEDTFTAVMYPES